MSGGKINGVALAKKMLCEVSELIQKEKQAQVLSKAFEQPRLAIILVGDNPFSQSYIRRKRYIAQKIHIKSRLFQIEDLPDPHHTTHALEATLRKLNQDPKYHGILLQLPLPPRLRQSEDRFIDLIDPLKDVDCLTSQNKGELIEKGDQAYLLPCTVHGVMEMLRQRDICLAGKRVLVIGKGKLAGEPIERLLNSKKDCASVCVANQDTPLEQIRQAARSADIIFSATGKPDLLRREDMKAGNIIIDIGVSRDPNKPDKVRGDICEKVKKSNCAFYTPVPRGVGPMTVSSLMFNTYLAWKRQLGLQKAKEQ